MKIWIINPYGNLPSEGWREYRSSLIAEAFVKEGHEVVWWVSNFEHRSKKYRSNSWEDIQVNDMYLIKLVPTTPYKTHISLARIKHERNYANNFKKKVMESDENADLIIIGEPALFFSDIIIDVINKKSIPFIIDILDLWPELFNILLPNKVSYLGRIVFAPLYWRRSWLLKKADGLIGATNDYLKIGKNVNKTPYNEVVYLGIDLNQKENHLLVSDTLKNIKKEKGETWVIYAGTLGDNYDIKTILKCVEKLEYFNLPIKIFIAGDGSLKSLIIDAIKMKNMKKLVYLGRLNIDDLNFFYHKCDMALSSYVESSTVSMPVKAFDYLVAGLPLVNSLNRELGNIVKTHNVGLRYKAEDSDDMFKVIKYLSEDKDSLKCMKKNALELAKTFDKEIQYKKFVTMSDKLVKEKIS